MIIPIKCVTCGMVLADKYQYYTAKVRSKKMENGMEVKKVIYYTKEMSKTEMVKTPEAEVLDDLGLTNVCCRRHMLTHVDIE
jgi:DNA-directed RNA polymerase I, II, and III subunit RPABC5